MRSRMHIAATLPLAIVLIPTFWFAACSSSVLAGFTYGVLKSISVTPSSVTLTKGSSQQFVATGTYSSGATLNLTKSVIWSSSNTTVGTISKSGLAAAKGAGSATIKATFGRYTGSAILNVTGATSAVLVSISVTPASTVLTSGGTQQYAATGTYSDGSTKSLTSSAAWSSSSPSVATISSSGLATAKSAGTTTIRATSGSVTGSAALAVASATLTAISITPSSASLTAGGTQQFTATGTYSDGSTQNLTSSVTWSSSSPSVATISSSGLAAAKSVGTTTIRAASSSHSASAVLTVTNGSSGTGGCDGAGNCYVYAAAKGAGTGANWTNAYTGFGTGAGQVNPAIMTRSITYWIANGSYGAHTFSTPESGTEVITIEGATASNHGPATDWNATYAGQAVFGVGVSSFETGYWTVEGQTRGSDWQSGYTIKFDLNGFDSQGGVVWTGGRQGSGDGVSHLTFDYVEVRGSNMNYTYNSNNPANCIHYCDAGFLTDSPTSNFYVGHSWIHDVGDTQFQSNDNAVNNSNGSNWIIEYNYISRDRTGDQTSGNHAEAFSLTAQNVVIRYNYFQDIGSSGVITDASAGEPDVGPWYIYGNIVFWTNNTGYPGIGDGFVTLLGETMHGSSYIVGNTIANINNPRCGTTSGVCNMLLVYTVGGGDYGTPTIYVENNLLWNVANGGCYIPESGWTFVLDYNSVYASPRFNNCGSHAQTTASSNPFANWTGSGTPIVPYENLNFQLAADTSPGNNGFSGIPAGCTAGVNCANVSFNGLVYGADGVYDRGAMQLPAK